MRMNCTFAQELYFSNNPKLNSKTFYSKVIGENSTGIYLLRFKDPDIKYTFSVDIFNHNLDFLESQDFKLSNGEQLEKIMTTDSGLILITHTQSRKNKKAELYYFRNGLKNIPKPIQLFLSPDFEKTGAMHIQFNSNRTLFAIWIEQSNKGKNQKIQYYLVNHTGNILDSFSYSTKLEDQNCEIFSTELSNTGESAMLLCYEPEEIDQKRKWYAFYKKPKKELLVRYINEKKELKFQNLKIGINDFYNSLLITGFYSEKEQEKNQGIYIMELSDSLLETEPGIIEFTNEEKEKILGKKLKGSEDEMSDFFIRKIVARSDKGVILIAEQFKIQPQYETILINGSPQMRSTNIYFYGDIVAIALDSVGTMEWQQHIFKQQNSLAQNSHLSSLATVVCEKEIYMLYNDNNNIENRIVLWKLKRNGNLEQQILFKGNYAGTSIIPIEGKQIGYNRYVVPYQQNKDTQLLKIVFDNADSE